MTHPEKWSRKELKAYLLLYAAHSDFIETEDEKKLIISKVDKATYKRIHKEFDSDNDFERIEKITDGLSAHDYTSEELEQLMADMKEVFLADGEYDTLERNLMMIMEHIMKKV